MSFLARSKLSKLAIAAMVPFESFRAKPALIKGELRRSDAERKSSAGRKPWDEVVIFKVLLCRRSTISPTIVRRQRS
jgi:hypothetical protein